MKSLLNANLYMKHFRFTCSLLGQNRQAIEIFRAFLKANNSAVCAEFAMGSKFQFSQCPILELEKPLSSSADIYRRWCKLNFGP